MTSQSNSTPTTPWLTAEQAARYLQVALGTLRNWTSMKYVPHVKRRGVVRYHKEELDRWLKAGACKGRLTLADLEPKREIN